MSVSNARHLLTKAEDENDPTRRLLLVAAAVREVWAFEPIVVGGAAQDFYTEPRYHPTDLDMCAPFDDESAHRLEELGFEKQDRHWYHASTAVALEFPESHIDGDVSRTITVDVEGGRARIIGIDDLYLDRVRQSTMTEAPNDQSLVAAAAIAAARFEDIDWRYVKRVIDQTAVRDRMLGEAMARMNRKARSRAKRAL